MIAPDIIKDASRPPSASPIGSHEEMADADLNDQRLNRRLKLILSDLARHPTASIPAACGGYAETAAAYRFFDNDKVDFDGVLRPHVDCTRARIAAQPVVLLVPDTTEIDVTRPRAAGPRRRAARRRRPPRRLPAPDARLHPRRHAAGDRSRRSPGLATTTRPRTPPRPAAERAAEPIEEKESYRWLLSMQQARAEAARCPGTQFVFVADSESDIYDVIAEGMERPRTADWIIRSCQDRALVDDLGRTGPCWTTSARRSWRRRCSTGGRSRSVVGPRRWPARIVTDVSRGSRDRRSSRSGPSRVTLRAPERTAGQAGRCHGERRAGHRGGPAARTTSRWSGSC